MVFSILTTVSHVYSLSFSTQPHQVQPTKFWIDSTTSVLKPSYCELQYVRGEACEAQIKQHLAQ